MGYYHNYNDYDILWDYNEDEEVRCDWCGGIFYKLGNWCICSECGQKIHIDDFEDYVNHAL